jgi:hypothetical protein
MFQFLDCLIFYRAFFKLIPKLLDNIIKRILYMIHGEFRMIHGPLYDHEETSPRFSIAMFSENHVIRALVFRQELYLTRFRTKLLI